MPSVKVILKKDKIDKNGEAPIYLRIIKDRKAKYISLGIKVKPKDWDETKGKVRKSHKNSQRINNFLAHKVADAEDIALEMTTKSKYVNPKKIKEEILGINSRSFIKYYEEYLDELQRKQKVSSYLMAKSALKKLKTYIGGRDLSFDEIDYHFLKMYDRYLTEELGNSVNTVYHNLKIIKKLFNDAIREDIFPIAKNPFLKYKLKTAQTEKSFLTEDELKAIENLELNKNTKIYHHRNIYVFAVYAAGLRISDVLQLKWSNYDGERILVKTQKKQKIASIKLPTKAKEIIELYKRKDAKSDDYIFPFLDSEKEYTKEELHRKITSITTYVNHNLKKIAEMAGIDKKIHFHTSRHTFATLALKKGMRIEYVSKLMTHSSIKTTQVYAKIVNEDLDKAMDKYFK